MSNSITQITSRDQLLEKLHSEHVSTWDMVDERNIMCGVDHVYRTVSPAYQETARRFDPNLPDEFFIDFSAAVNTAVAMANDLAKEEGESDYDYVCRKHNARDKIKERLILNEHNFWVFRECWRSWSGQYKTVEFLTFLHRAKKFKREYMYHFPHVSVDDPTMMAYTPSHEYGKRDRQVRLRIGKYLQKYYSDVLTSEEIRSFANGAKGFELKFGTTKEDFRRIYRLGPHSCMASRRDRWDGASGDFHPLDVYEGEFRLAYIEPTVDNIVARAFVHDISRTWVRAYGDEANTLIDMIEAAGYTRASGWCGARLKYVVDNDGKRLMPYLDGDDKDVDYCGGPEPHWRITDSGGDYHCASTCGFIEEDVEEEHYCPRCSHQCDEDDLRYSEYEDTSFCDNCSDDFTWAIVDRRGGRDYVHNDSVVENRSNGEYYTPEAAEDLGLVQDYEGDYWDVDDLVETVEDELVHIDDAIPVGEGEYGETLYYAPNSVPIDCVFIIEGNGIDTIIHEDYIPEDVQKEIDDQNRVTNDFGLIVPEKYFTFREMLLTYGVEETYLKLRRVGFGRLNRYPINSAYESYQRLPVAA